MLSTFHSRRSRDQRCDGYADGFKAGRADKLLGRSICAAQPSDMGYSGRYAQGYRDGQQATRTLAP